MFPLVSFMPWGNAQDICVRSCLNNLFNSEFLKGGSGSFTNDTLVFGLIIFCCDEEKLSLMSLPRLLAGNTRLDRA